MCRLERPGFLARHTKINAPAPRAAPQTSTASFAIKDAPAASRVGPPLGDQQMAGDRRWHKDNYPERAVVLVLADRSAR
jgi:hypothetical protein